MDFTPILKVMNKYYLDKQWNCGESYDTLEWNDTTIPKPTEEELNMKWEELKKVEMREERNQLLKDSDYVMLQDFPLTEEKKVEWVKYRADLRDFPAIWTQCMPFPTPPE